MSRCADTIDWVEFPSSVEFSINLERYIALEEINTLTKVRDNLTADIEKLQKAFDTGEQLEKPKNGRSNPLNDAGHGLRPND